MLKFELFSFQIISSICEFVESCTPEIRSGWRPLFGALRCVRPPSALPSPSVPGGLPGMDLLNYDFKILYFRFTTFQFGFVIINGNDNNGVNTILKGLIRRISKTGFIFEQTSFHVFT